MDRFLLDLDNLPKAKKEVILAITSSYSEKRKVAFVKSLIFLGFSTIKQNDIDVASANIAKSTNVNSPKFRVILANTPIATFLKTFTNQTSKRSCVYAFLYAGISSYIEYMDVINKGGDKKTIDVIEKKLFLCGLSDHLSQNISLNIVVQPTNMVIQPANKAVNTPTIEPLPTTLPPQTKEPLRGDAREQNDGSGSPTHPPKLNREEKTSKSTTKPKFKIDGV